MGMDTITPTSGVVGGITVFINIKNLKHSLTVSKVPHKCESFVSRSMFYIRHSKG